MDTEDFLQMRHSKLVQSLAALALLPKKLDFFGKLLSIDMLCSFVEAIFVELILFILFETIEDLVEVLNLDDFLFFCFCGMIFSIDFDAAFSV